MGFTLDKPLEWKPGVFVIHKLRTPTRESELRKETDLLEKLKRNSSPETSLNWVRQRIKYLKTEVIYPVPFLFARVVIPSFKDFDHHRHMTMMEDIITEFANPVIISLISVPAGASTNKSATNFATNALALQPYEDEFHPSAERSEIGENPHRRTGLPRKIPFDRGKP